MPYNDFKNVHKEELEAILAILTQLTCRPIEQIEPHLKTMLQHLLGSENQEIVPTQRSQAFQEWVTSHQAMNLPVLSDEAISRESIYGE
ncbi:MAG: hypothetical protein SW833_00950 [Cyanobacteriota bacterium]|nr:hypothetical protein [Cyanobacteriota bacterium]